MSFKNKIIFILLTIITGGLFPIITFKKKNIEESNELSTINKITIDLKSVVEYLGSIDNIIGVEVSYTKLKVFIKNNEKIDVPSLESSKGISGLYVTSKAATLIVGKSARTIATKFEELLN